jgi:energy-coupling factor transporter ATP-binding protein EcfA2
MPQGIDKIIIKNFKAFPVEEIIDLHGKHLLVYGENGSGKSSIYWALYTLFQAKDKGKERTEKYFDRTHPENLLNVFTENEDAHIKVSLTAEPEVFYVLDRTGVHVEGESQNQNDVVVGLNNSSDFISHRLLINFYNYRNSREIDLWRVFERDVIPFLKTNRGQGERTLSTLYNEIVDNRPYRLLANGNIELKRVKEDYTKKIKDFNDDLVYWVSEINTDVNGFYETYFQSDSEKKLQIKLELIEDLRYEFIQQIRKVDNSEFPFKSKDLKEIQYPFIKLSISIEKDDGTFKPIDRPQSFLNEAKLTAIALSVRFVLLQPHIRPAFPGRILALDDLLISLDMSNRDRVTNLVFDEYLDSFQTIILTHNREYFIWAKHELENRELLNNGDWAVLEMYVDELNDDNHNRIIKPKILKSENELTIAHKHFKNHDYPAAANYLRKHAESILCNWLPPQYWMDKESKEQSKKKIPFQNIINNGIKFLGRIHQEPKLYKELRKFVGILLNPLSHADVGVVRYKEEIIRVFKVLDEIISFQASINYSLIIAGGKEFEIRILKPSTSQTYVYSFELQESLYSVSIDGIDKISKCKVNSKYCYPIEADGTVVFSDKRKFERFTNKEINDVYTDMCIHEAEFTAQANLRPLLFRKNGTNL